jgi:hypothetical protein
MNNPVVLTHPTTLEFIKHYSSASAWVSPQQKGVIQFPWRVGMLCRDV